MTSIALTNEGDSFQIKVPIKLKRRRGGRKEVILPEGLDVGSATPNAFAEPLAIAVARGFRWKELMESGKYSTITEMAENLGICCSYISRLMRFTLLAPDIIEAVLEGTGPRELSINQLSHDIPASWEEQRAKYGFSQ